MKKIGICTFALLGMFPAPAMAAVSPAQVIANHLEVKAVIAAFEQNRDQRCSPLREENAEVMTHNQVKATINCNQHDTNREPQANVSFIEIKGSRYLAGVAQ